MTEAQAGVRLRTGFLEGNGLAHVILAVGAAVMAFPFLWLIILSLSTNAQIIRVPPTWWPGTLRFDNFAEVFRRMPFLSEFRVSIVITVLRTLGQLLLCSMAGYAFGRMQFRGRKFLFGLLLSVLLVPPQVFLIPQYQIVLNLGLLNTTAGIVLPGFFSAFGVFLMRQFFASLPDELEEAARLDGCNPWQLFWKVLLPLVKPALAALAIITVLWSWNDLMWPLVVTTYSEKMPLSVGIATLQGQHDVNYAVMMAASLMAMAPIIIVFLSMQRRVIAGIAFSGLK
jgi:multiple sugar transport system permease protein